MRRKVLTPLACLWLMPLGAWADEPPAPTADVQESAPAYSPVEVQTSSRRSAYPVPSSPAATVGPIAEQAMRPSAPSAPSATHADEPPAPPAGLLDAPPAPGASLPAAPPAPATSLPEEPPAPPVSTQGPANLPNRMKPKRAVPVERLPQAPTVPEEVLPPSVSREQPRQIPNYEATAAPDAIESLLDGGQAEPLEPLGRQTEIIRERYPNGSVRIERHVTQDEKRNYVNHGPWTMWDQQGNLLAKGKYQFGRQEGQWVRRYVAPRDGILQLPSLRGFERPVVSTLHFADGQLHGPWTIVDARGRPVASWYFERGQLHGPAIWWYSNGRKMRSANYQRGVPDGDFVEWQADGDVARHIRYENGRSFTPVTHYYRDGSVRIEGWQVNPVEEHRLGYDWWKGEVLIDVIAPTEGGLRTGMWAYYYPGGQKMYEGEYHEGEPIGVHSWWHANGQRMTRGSYHAGQPHGTWTWWYPNGQRRIEGRYANGEPDRGWVGWTESGQAVSLDETEVDLPSPPPTREDSGDWSSAKAMDGTGPRFTPPKLY